MLNRFISILTHNFTPLFALLKYFENQILVFTKGSVHFCQIFFSEIFLDLVIKSLVKMGDNCNEKRGKCLNFKSIFVYKPCI